MRRSYPTDRIAAKIRWHGFGAATAATLTWAIQPCRKFTGVPSMLLGNKFAHRRWIQALASPALASPRPQQILRFRQIEMVVGQRTGDDDPSVYIRLSVAGIDFRIQCYQLPRCVQRGRKTKLLARGRRTIRRPRNSHTHPPRADTAAEVWRLSQMKYSAYESKHCLKCSTGSGRIRGVI